MKRHFTPDKSREAVETVRRALGHRREAPIAASGAAGDHSQLCVSTLRVAAFSCSCHQPSHCLAAYCKSEATAVAARQLAHSATAPTNHQQMSHVCGAGNMGQHDSRAGSAEAMELLDSVMRLMRPEGSVPAGQAQHQQQQQQGSQPLRQLTWDNWTTSGTGSDQTPAPLIASSLMGAGDKIVFTALYMQSGHLTSTDWQCSGLPLAACHIAWLAELTGKSMTKQTEEAIICSAHPEDKHIDETLLAGSAGAEGTVSSCGSQLSTQTSFGSSASPGQEQARISHSFTQHGNLKWLIGIDQLVRVSQAWLGLRSSSTHMLACCALAAPGSSTGMEKAACSCSQCFSIIMRAVAQSFP